MKNLYEISKDLARIYAELEENNGELTESLERDLKINEATFKEKAIGYCKIIQNTKASVNAMEEEIKRLRNRKEVMEKIIERLKFNLATYMDIGNQDAIDLGLFKLSFRRSESVELTIDTMEKLPAEYVRRVTIEPDKAKIKQDLKDGKPLDFAILTTNRSLQIK